MWLRNRSRQEPDEEVWGQGQNADGSRCGQKTATKDYTANGSDQLAKRSTPRTIEFVVGILSAMGVNQNVDIRRLHRKSAPLIPELGQLRCCLVKMNRLAENWHLKMGVILLERLFSKKIIPERRIHKLTQGRPLIARLTLRASKKLVIEYQCRSHSCTHKYAN